MYILGIVLSNFADSFHCLTVVVCILALNFSSYFQLSEVYSMDKLPADQQAAITKTSSDWLRQTLLSAGEEEATVSAMDRDALKEVAARQKLQGPVETSSMEWELALRRLELEFELEVKKMEIQKQKASEVKKLELEKQKESERLEKENLEYQKRENEAERMDREYERQRLEREKDRAAKIERLERDKAIEMEMMMEKTKLEMEHELKMKKTRDE